MSAEDILEQISGILDDDSISAPDKVYMIKDVIHGEIADGKTFKIDEAKRAVSA